MPDGERVAARAALNRVYDRFVSKYGPINKTTFSLLHAGTDRETEVRRMPNVVKFREDPDAFLVMSLEEYDDTTGRATKAAIMRQDVVGAAAPVDVVRSAEEGLLVSLNERGVVDLPFIGRLYGREPAEVVAELGDLLFHDPRAGEYVTRDAYLSGNVRQKLAAAQASVDPRHQRNVAALLDVQPEDLLPGDIDANLGAPWLPVSDIEEFAASLFKVGSGSVEIAHLPRDALWTVAGNYSVRGSVANTAEFGTDRADGLTLLEQALNLRTPTIFDHHQDGSRTLNQTATVAASRSKAGSSSASATGSSLILTALTAWCASTTTASTTCACASSTART